VSGMEIAHRIAALRGVQGQGALQHHELGLSSPFKPLGKAAESIGLGLGGQGEEGVASRPAKAGRGRGSSHRGSRGKEAAKPVVA
jgi:hypothetical protein